MPPGGARWSYGMMILGPITLILRAKRGNDEVVEHKIIPR